MTRKRYVVAFAAALLLSSSHAIAEEGAAAPQTAAPAAETIYHKIVPRDTLWDITEKYLNDPFKWPGVWKLNPYIRNPHLIYPGNIVKITPDGIEILEPGDAKADALEKVPVEDKGESTLVLEPEGEEAAAAVEAPAPPKAPTVKDQAIMRSGFVSMKEFEGSGAVVAPRDERLFISKGDDVVLSFKEGSAPASGDRYLVYVTKKMIKHPETGKKLGYEVDILGSLKVTSADGTPVGTIDRSFKEIPAGARLKPWSELVTEVEISDTDARVTGIIVMALESKENISAGDIVYIDKGSKDGLRSGNMMRIFRPVKNAADPMNAKKKVEMPPVELGTFVVLETGEASSTGLVVKSFNSIVWGDRVSTTE
ncbi:MAG TPA: hypothetical protein VII64_07015 [Thermodesulfobacteriota bacterium]